MAGFPQFTDGQVDYLVTSAIAMLLMAPPKAATAHAVGERTPCGLPNTRRVVPERTVHQHRS